MDRPTPDHTSSAPAPLEALAPSPRERAVDAWFAKHFHGLGPMLDTPLYNLLHAAKEDLKQLLAALP